MNISLFFTLYAISVPIFFLIDMLWLGVIAKEFYRSRIGHLMGDVNWVAAIGFYLIFFVGLTIFATYPAATQSSWKTATLFGALFGFFTYATYDLTNLATLKAWPLSVVLVDVAWGTILGAAVATVAYGIYSAI